MEFILIWFGMAIVTGIAAQSRGRSFFGWFCLGFLFSIFALIAVLVMAPAGAATATPATSGAPYPSARATRKSDDRVVKTYKGYMIRKSGDGYLADGEHHRTVFDAENWIDRQPGTPLSTATKEDAPKTAADTLFYLGHPITEDGDRFIVDEVSYPSLGSAKRAIEKRAGD